MVKDLIGRCAITLIRKKYPFKRQKFGSGPTAGEKFREILLFLQIRCKLKGFVNCPY